MHIHADGQCGVIRRPEMYAFFCNVGGRKTKAMQKEGKTIQTPHRMATATIWNQTSQLWFRSSNHSPPKVIFKFVDWPKPKHGWKNVSFRCSCKHLAWMDVFLAFLDRLYKGVAGFCSAYRGEVCRTILREDSLVFFNASMSDPEDVQEYLIQSWWTEFEGLSKLCGPAVRSLLCHTSFPDCNPSGLGPAPKPVCR